MKRKRKDPRHLMLDAQVRSSTTEAVKQGPKTSKAFSNARKKHLAKNLFKLLGLTPSPLAKLT